MSPKNKESLTTNHILTAKLPKYTETQTIIINTTSLQRNALGAGHFGVVTLDYYIK